MVRDSNYNENS
jgi:Ca2+-binding EF-hand superfamily protein